MVDEGRPDVAKVLAGLKPFQRDTVEHVFERLYGDPESSHRFLISDEVGLGKTLVARGVIAKAIDHLWPKLPDIDRIDVVYICSNAAIARQNINRLNVMGREAAVHASRVTMLPTQLKGLRERKVNFVSFTPGTSFDLKSSMGMWKERVVLYWMLREIWGFGDVTGPKNLFQGGVSYKSQSWFRNELAQFSKNGVIDQGLLGCFAETLEGAVRSELTAGRPTLRDRFDDLADRFQYLKRKPPRTDTRDQNVLIGELRALLAESCIRALEPDLVVLDEFQRFKHLLDENNEAGMLARRLVNYSDDNTEVRVILLSATPYKMYTLHAEKAMDDHYRDFLHTLGFLMDETRRTQRVEGLLQRFRSEVYRAHEDDVRGLREVKEELERELARVMARTERLSSTRDVSGMLREMVSRTVAPSVDELCDFPPLQRLSDVLDAGGMIEYWKSAPYLLNFMQGYKIKNELKKRVKAQAVEPEVVSSLVAAKRALLTRREVEAYAEVDPRNVRLRGLMDDTLGREWWRLLWVPAAMPYYRADGAYRDLDPGEVTKRLVFSSWEVVPRAVSVLMSYEAERRRFGSFEEEPVNTAEARKRRAPLLQFTYVNERYTGLPVLCLLYPSIELARLGDVKSAAWAISADGLPELGAVLDMVKYRIEPGLTRLIAKYGSDTGIEDERWYWAAPMLLDLDRHQKEAREWFEQKKLSDVWSMQAWDDEDGQGGNRWKEHVAVATALALKPGDLGRPPEDLLALLAEMAVASPAVCALRALARVTGGMKLTSDVVVRTAAGQVGWAFRALYNRPSVVAMIRGLYTSVDLPYWRLALRYCADGVLQSVLDEYAHVLRDSLGVRDHDAGEAAVQIAAEMAGALTMRTVTIGVDEIRSEAGKVSIDGHRMRISFAMAFGDHKDESQREGVRQEQIRSAFNSPFRPFVLASTSVGQEGLDFHQYCHAVVHWNLPSNPVDLEQREGRVHRYKCHAVRKNLAQVFRDKLEGLDASDPWEALFQIACAELPDLHRGMVPFWVFDPPDGVAIERHVPTIPLSQDEQRYEDLRRSLAAYRMVFGQPRQEDLLAYLVDRVSPERLEELRPLLQIDLRPNAREEGNA